MKKIILIALLTIVSCSKKDDISEEDIFINKTEEVFSDFKNTSYYGDSTTRYYKNSDVKIHFKKVVSLSQEFYLLDKSPSSKAFVESLNRDYSTYSNFSQNGYTEADSVDDKIQDFLNYVNFKLR